MFPEIGDLVFSLVVGYMGALEFLYVVRHLYHWSFRHNPEMRNLKNEATSLQKLQDQLRNSISEADEKETQGLKAMKDGVLYKDGFRVDANQKEIDELKDKVKKKEQTVERQREIEVELARQRKIEEETRKQLKEAEDELRRVEEEKEKQKLKEEEEENARKILESERKREEEQRRLEKEKEEEEEKQRLKQVEEEENARKMQAVEREREEMQRKREIEEEEEIRKSLEAEREREEAQRQQEMEEENVRKLLEAEREMEEKQRQQELDDEEIIRKLLEAERKREQEEEEEENTRKLLEAEREREESERMRELEEENTRKLIEADRELQEEQQRFERDQARQRIEDEENYRRLLQMEREMEERELRAMEEQQALLEHTATLEREAADRLLAAEIAAEERQRMIEENEENMNQLLEVERQLELKKRELEEEEENIRKIIEAENEMEQRQRRIDEEALEKLKNAQEEIELRQALDAEGENEDTDELMVEKEIAQSEQVPIQTVKTQYGQTSSDSLKPKTLLFPGVSEESSSAEPISSQQSSFSTQQSSEAALPDLLFDEHERQAPDGGEDLPSLQYSDEYLRSLDGIKNKPLVREDGSGRRRAFKKRRSSGSSTSSRESRASREEELKMFTSLEEEELENIRKGDSEYETIKYASEPGLKVGKQHRRHKRSPAKESKHDTNEAAKGPLGMLDEEDSNPWGEGKPEHYKDTDFWKREKKLSIDEELEETDANERIQSPTQSAVNIPKMSSFEEATKSQHEEAISALQRQRSKDPEPIKEPDEESDTKNVSRLGNASSSPAGSDSTSAFASASISHTLKSPKNETEEENSQETEFPLARTPSPSSTGGGLRRSPRVDEMKQYKENWKSEERKARSEASENPAIEIDYPSDDEFIPEPEKDYLMEGISDFYDFNASINPSRSRSRSRSKTPAVSRSVSPHQHRSPSPQNVSYNPAKTMPCSPSPDPASYKFIYQCILSSQATEEQDFSGLSDFYDFNSKLNREALTGATTKRSNETHRTSVDYVMEDLTNNNVTGGGGAIPKQIDGIPPNPEYHRSISADWRDIQKIKEELLSGSFKRSTYVGESMDFSDQFESLREEAKSFKRSRSRSRSPCYDVSEMTAKVLAKKELQEKILDEIQKATENMEEFSSDTNTQCLIDRNRRASDTALIQKPEILFQIQDFIQESEENLDVGELEAEEYHHFRRFSLNQEMPIEQYPEDCLSISEMKVQSLGDLRTWTEDIASENVTATANETDTLEIESNLLAELHEQNLQEGLIEEAYESGSDDERQTVVEVEDEIDEDIWDYNERPEESHNEQSECEEADREMDRYADRRADDWRDVEGAVGGVPDEDSFQIDQIYDEAIKNRKASGILRDYDSIVQEIQTSDEDHLDEERLISKIRQSNDTTNSWSPRNRSSRASSGESSRGFLEYEKRENERRYLGDATLSAINSTRLRSRYGIVPSTSFTTTYDDDTNDTEINYVPKKEYNWRKNFKLDDDETDGGKEAQVQYLDPRRLSVGGESIILFSQSPEYSEEEKDLKRVIEVDEDIHDQLDEEMEQEPEELLPEKPKKKKNKRKSRKGSKGSIEEKESLSRRNSIITDNEAPRKKSRGESRDNVDGVPGSPPSDAALQEADVEETQSKKKSKKRRKNKSETTLPSLDIKLPSAEKKGPPPSVAAIRAALVVSSTEAKSSTSSRNSPMTEKTSKVSTVEIEQSPYLRNSNSADKESLVKSSGLCPSMEMKKSASLRISPVTDKESISLPRESSPPTLTQQQSDQRFPSDNSFLNLHLPLLSASTPNESSLPESSNTIDLPTLVTQSPSTSSNNEQGPYKNTPKNSPTSDTFDIIKDGGLYPLF